MAVDQDKTQFGLTKENNGIIERIDAMKLFPNQAEAAKFAMSLSIREGAVPGTVSLAETKWNKGGFDPQGEIAETIRALFPEITTPYRAIEFFVNDGLERLGKEIAQKGTLDMLTLLETAKLD
jgi:hypothetical protein